MNTTESSAATSDRTTPAATVPAQPAGTEPLDFRAIRKNHPTTWEAALDANATVTQGGRPDLFLVNAIDEVPQNCSLPRHRMANLLAGVAAKRSTRSVFAHISVCSDSEPRSIC